MSQNSKDYLLDHIRKAKNEIYFYFTGWNLPFFRQSIDKEIFEETDINKNYKRKTFFMSHRIVFGSNTAKRLVIGMLQKNFGSNTAKRLVIGRLKKNQRA